MALTLRRHLRRLLGQDPGIDVRLGALDTLTLGTEYGAHTVCRDGLSANSVVYSFGVGEDASFDLELIGRFACTIHAFDPTPRSIAWVAGQGMPEAFRMHPFGLATHDGTARFSPPVHPQHVSHTLVERPETAERAIEVQVKRLSTIAAELGHTHLDVLKVDIEGAEYEWIDSMSDGEVPDAEQLLLEFHHHFSEIPARRTFDAVEKLRALGYQVFHVADNDRDVSLIRRS